MQVTCWLLLAAVLLLLPLFNFFGGLALLHGYLAASGRTSYEICKGAKVNSYWILPVVRFRVKSLKADARNPNAQEKPTNQMAFTAWHSSLRCCTEFKHAF